MFTQQWSPQETENTQKYVYKKVWNAKLQDLIQCKQ